MANKVDYRLPPITSLSLDFPLLLPPHPSQIPPQQHFHDLSSQQLAAASSKHGPFFENYARHQRGASAGTFYTQTPHAVLPQAAASMLQHSHVLDSALAEYMHAQAKPTLSPFGISDNLLSSGASGSVSGAGAAEDRAFAAKSSDTYLTAPPLLQQPSPSSSRRSSSPSPLADRMTLPPNTISAVPGTVSASAKASKSPDCNKEMKEMKRRKKRQCPECHLFFSNLATHKLTHLNPTARPHVCEVCQRGFTRPNDLFRHYKCHWKETGADNGQFRCPFKLETAENQCSHSLGIFSRCDTYKNHLKAIHFDYPGGTRKAERGASPGRCGLCQKQFLTVDEWLHAHVDTHQCEFMKH